MMTFLQKLYSGIAIGVLFLIGAIYMHMQPQELPSLTHLHQFSNCPFSVMLPGEPRVTIENNIEEASIVVQDNLLTFKYAMFITCIKREIGFSNAILPDEIAQEYFDRIIKKEEISENKKIDIDFNSNYAQIKYQSKGRQNQYFANIIGAIFVYNDSVAILDFDYANDKFKTEDIKLFFESLDIRPTN